MEDHPSRVGQLQERHHEILYRTSPAWLVPDGRGLPYPGDWAGRIVSVRPAGHSWGPGDLADPNRGVIRLELTDEEARACRRGEVRFGLEAAVRNGGAPPILPKSAESVARPLLTAVGFDERWGALAAGLRRRFGSEAERLETEARAEADAPPGEVPPRDHPFEVAARELKAGLPRMVTHSGAGLYEVGPGKTYSTIQSALDQLWTDQGASTFTASQYIRVFAGTYDDNVVPNAGLDPDEANSFGLIIEGDPADDRANMVIQPAGGTNVLSINCDAALLRKLTFDGANTSSHTIAPGSGCMILNIDDCAVTAVGGSRCISMGNTLHAVDSTFTGGTTYNVLAGAYRNPAYLERCTIIGGTVGVYTYYQMDIRACVFDGCTTGVSITKTAVIRLSQCVFYNNTVAVNILQPLHSSVHVINCIFKDCTYNYRAPKWPEETATTLGPSFVQRNNCYHGYTAMGYDGSTTKTYAEWIAFNQVDAAGELDATDPLLTDPASDDFSLAAGSPCRHAGIGAGVLSDYLRNAFDTVYPDIGAASSGTVETPSRPSAEVAAVDGETITVSIEGDAGTEHRAELVRARTGEIVDTESRDGDGQVSLTAPELCARYFVVASSANAAGRSLPSLPCEVIVPEGEGPLEEVRIGIVSRLAAHAGLAEILGTDETGAVPVYAAGPECPKRLPCVVYTLSAVPDGELDRAGRWLVTLALDAWGGSAGVNDSVVSVLDEVLHRQPFDMTSWMVKRISRTGGGTRWADDGRTEIRYTTWSLVVDRCVT